MTQHFRKGFTNGRMYFQSVNPESGVKGGIGNTGCRPVFFIGSPGTRHDRFSMFSYHSDTGYRESLPGIRQKTLVYGDHTLMTEFRLDRGSDLPKHSHPHEQTGYLVSGHITLRIGAEESEIRPGDSWTIPGNVEHSATIHHDSVAIEIFSPVRKEYLP